ncbi:MAG: transcriptional repressor LexA [Planctomycetota bacterium]|jgi:repressor LexA
MGRNIQITPKQLETLRQVENFLRSQCYSATIGELAAALNISRTTAYEHIAGLREKGLLVRSTGKARCLRLTSSGERLLEQAREIEATQAAESEPDEFVNDAAGGIFLRGRVSAGYGIEAIEEQTPFSLPAAFGSADDIFVLEVCGESMIDAGIDDGDFVICKSAQTANDGQIVIAMLDDEQATMKRFYRDKKAARLMPANDAFEPIYSTTCRIQAVVIGAVKQF